MKTITKYQNTIGKALMCFATLVLSLELFAQEDSQDLQKTIQVYSEYKPQISDASRISVNPKVYDTLDLQVNLNYSVSTSPLNLDYQIIPLRAVSVKGDKLQELYRGEATIGLGNYATGLLAVRYMTERSRLKQSGVELFLNGSLGKIKLDNDEKVPAHYTTDYFSAYWKRFYEKFTLYASIKPSYKSAFRYGHQICGLFETGKDTIVKLKYDNKDIRRNRIGLNANFGLISNDTDVDALRYNADVDYDLTFAMNPKNVENLLNVSGGVEKTFSKVQLGIDAGYKVSLLNFEPDDTTMTLGKLQSVLKAMPYAQVGANTWKIRVGIKLSPILGGYSSFKIFPDVAFSYNLPKLQMTPYFNFYGNVDQLSMKEMMDENPYVADSMFLHPTINKLGFDLGVSGRVKKLITYNAAFTVKAYDDMYFWHAKDRSLGKITTFDAVYDNATLMRIHGDFGMLFRKVNFGLDMNYNYWQTDLKYAWYKPIVEITTSSEFAIINPNSNKTKLTVTPKIYYMRYQSDWFDGDIAKTNIFDLGLEAAYSYNSVLRVFADVNNILGLQTERYGDYPLQRINFLIGLSYSFGGHNE